ncbi:50S ribosomal protein L10e [uncultured archaeon]|nr:50S ribosomal protein L10e [uncultured archaeon]
MGLRPAKCYRSPRNKKRLRNGASGHSRRTRFQRAYTRIAINVPDRNYIGAAPQLKIRQFNMGNPLLKYDTVADLLVKDSIDIRDNALESVRSTVNRKLVKDLGKDAYFMKLRVFPSNLMRENKQAQGAGADRVSQGMTLAFGIPIGRTARVRAGQVIMSVLCMKDQKEKVRIALLRANAKFPCKIEIVFHEDIKSLGTLPSKAIEEKVVEVKKEVTAEGAAATGAEGAAGTTPQAGAKPGAPGAAAPAAGAKPETGKPAAGDKKAPAKNPGKKGN